VTDKGLILQAFYGKLLLRITFKEAFYAEGSMDEN